MRVLVNAVSGSIILLGSGYVSKLLQERLASDPSVPFTTTVIVLAVQFALLCFGAKIVMDLAKESLSKDHE